MFTDEEKKVLEQFVTSADADIFAVRGMPGLVGAAYARYSRAKGGFREVLLKEFVQEGAVDAKKAAELIERVLVAYGDDSVGELEGAHVSFEQVSMLEAKEIEDRRIGGSPIEQSTRYVYYDQKNDQGQFRYYRGKDVTEASFGAQYTAVMDEVFQTYTDLVEPLRVYLEGQKPIAEAEYDIDGDGKKEKLTDLTDEKLIKSFKQTYGFELRAKACDILRGLLPVATLTNVGMFGNGRFYQNLLSYLLTTDLPENHSVAAGTQKALGEIIPQYIKRAARSEYIATTRAAMEKLAKELLGDKRSEVAERPHVHLLDRGEEIIEKRVRHEGVSAVLAMQEAQDVHTLAAMLYPYCEMSLGDLRHFVLHADEATRAKIVATYVGDRKTRRDRPGRALEDGYPYQFDFVTDFGTYKDLQRHRMNTQSRQLFTARLGFRMPSELDDVGLRDKVQACVDKVEALYEVMAKESPLLAQYAVLHGHYVRWSMGMNDREVMHLTELRSTPQGHPTYRTVAQLVHNAVKERSSWRGEAMKFVDHNDYYWSRADSEAKQRVKEAKLDAKFSKEK